MVPTKQAVRLRRTPRRWIVVHWARLYHQLAVSFMAPGVGNGVGGMLWPACQLTGLFMPGTIVSVGDWAENERNIKNQHYQQKQNRLYSLPPLWTEQALPIVIY